MTTLSYSQSVKKAGQTAKRTADNEVNKKVAKGVKDLFSGKKKKKKKEEEEKAAQEAKEAQEAAEAQQNQTGANGTSTTTSTDGENTPQNTAATNSNAPPTVRRAGSEFKRGERTIFSDQLIGEQHGEWPSKWNRQSGSVEVMQLGAENVIGFTNSAFIGPRIDREMYLPDEFTFEIDCFFHNRGNEAYSLRFEGGSGMKIVVRSESIHFNNDLVRTGKKPSAGWRHVAISFNKRAVKIFMDDQRMHNIPYVEEGPNKMTINTLTPGISRGEYPMIKNIHIAEGAIPLYDRLMTEGVFVTNDIHFDLNKATVKPESHAILNQVVDMMQNHPEVRVEIAGHTDNRGTNESNLDLSTRRAQSVKAYLVAHGVAGSRMTTIGYGEEKPERLGDNEEAWSLNRRVEFRSL